VNRFDKEVQERVLSNLENSSLLEASQTFMRESLRAKYSYNFSWLGRPIIQYPQDIVAVQEVIWESRPDLIIETGVAHGGSLILSASMLALLDIVDALDQDRLVEPRKSNRRVIGIDIEIRPHNFDAIRAHPLSSYIDLVVGSSTANEVVDEVIGKAKAFQRVMVLLDSNHTHEHVLRELECYADLTSVGCYCIVFDTVIEVEPAASNPERPWKEGDNPMTAVRQYLQSRSDFIPVSHLDGKLLLSVAPSGYLKRVM